jgi:hypothetical protein
VLTLVLLTLAPLAHAQTKTRVVIDKAKFEAVHAAITRLWAAQTARTGQARLMELAGDAQAEIVVLLDKAGGSSLRPSGFSSGV